MKKNIFYLLSILLLLTLSCASSGQMDQEGVIDLDTSQKYPAPSSIEQGLKEARELLGQKKYSQAAREAYRVFTHAKKIQQKGEARFLLAEAYYRAGSYQEAYIHFKILQKKYSNYQGIQQVLERMYEIGSAWVNGRRRTYAWLFTSRDIEKGMDILKELTTTYPYLRSVKGDLIADDAFFTLGEAYFRDSSYKECRQYYESLLRRYSESEWRDLAAFNIALSHLRESEGIVYDQEPLQKAKKKFREYLQKFPLGNKVKEAQELLAQIEEDQAGQLFETARWYLSKDNSVAAILYYQSIKKKYPQTSWAKKSEKKMSETWAVDGVKTWKKKK